MSEYWTTRRPPPRRFAHGWFHSGDVGRFGEDGVLWFADRYKDVIRPAARTWPRSRSRRPCTRRAAVVRAVVVGLPHERWTEAITAVVVPGR